MKLITLQACETWQGARRFKQSPIGSLIMTLIFLSIMVGIAYLYFTGERPLAILIISGGGCALFSLLGFSTFRKSLAAENWLVSLSPQIVQIKFRSYLNSHFPLEDPQVAEFELTEIASARIFKQTIKAQGQRNGTTTSWHTSLDLQIVGSDLQKLKEQLKHERQLKVSTTGRFGTTSTKHLHYPVSVVDQQTVRIEWRSASDHISPNIKVAIQQFSRLGVKIEPTQKEMLDFTITAQDQAEMETQILQLAERGNTLQAIKLTRKALGLSLAKSKTFVEDLLN